MTDRRTASTITNAELDQLYARIAEYENTITWHTTCTSCARILDSSIRETERAEKAEAAIARVRVLHREAYGCCEECTNSHAVLWPCPTIQALDTPAPAPAASEAPARACRIAAGGGFACPTHDPCTTCDKER